MHSVTVQLVIEDDARIESILDNVALGEDSVLGWRTWSGGRLYDNVYVEGPDRDEVLELFRIWAPHDDLAGLREYLTHAG